DGFAVLALVGALDGLAPQGIGGGPDLFVRLVDDVHAGLQMSGSHGLSGAQHVRHVSTPCAGPRAAALSDWQLTRRPPPGGSTAPSPSCTRRSAGRGAKPS